MFWRNSAIPRLCVRSRFQLQTRFWSSKWEQQPTLSNFDNIVPSNVVKFRIAELAEEDKDYKTALTYYKQAAEGEYNSAVLKLANYYEKGFKGKKDEINFEEALKYYQKAADSGVAAAQCRLGAYYLEKDVPEVDIALRYLLLAAAQRNTTAQYYLGYIYESSGDSKLAFEYYKLAAEGNDQEALLRLTRCYGEGFGTELDQKKVFETFEILANLENVQGLVGLGDCYFYGEGVQQNLGKGIEYYKKAALKGDADAQCCLGDCYYNGTGVDTHKFKAVEYYTFAASQNFPRAQLNLANCYYNGEGTEIDYDKAFYYYKLAADNDMPDAQHAVGVCYENGSGVEHDQRKAIAYFEMAADNGFADSQCTLGDYYADIEKNYKKAFLYYKAAADQGHTQAQCNMGAILLQTNDADYHKALSYLTTAAETLPLPKYVLGLFYEDPSCPIQDLQKALHYFTAAGKEGLPEALFKLGEYYENGCPPLIPQNAKQALEYFHKAAEKKYYPACAKLGSIYEEGILVPQDKYKAMEFYKYSYLDVFPDNK